MCKHVSRILQLIVRESTAHKMSGKRGENSGGLGTHPNNGNMGFQMCRVRFHYKVNLYNITNITVYEKLFAFGE